MANKTKNDEKTVKPTKVLSPKRQLEADHQQGKHKDDSWGDCGFCNRRSLRDIRKGDKTRAYFLANKR